MIFLDSEDGHARLVLNRDNGIRSILIVDNSKPDCLAAQKEIENHKTEVNFVCSAQECMDRLDENNGINLIVCEFSLPDQDGLWLYQRLKKLHDSYKTKKKYHKMFIMVSKSEEQLSEVRKLGIATCKKPDNQHEWRELVQLIEYKLQQTSTILDIMDLKKDTEFLKGKTQAIEDRMESVEATLRGIMDKTDDVLEHVKKISSSHCIFTGQPILGEHGTLDDEKKRKALLDILKSKKGYFDLLTETAVSLVKERSFKMVIYSLFFGCLISAAFLLSVDPSNIKINIFGSSFEFGKNKDSSVPAAPPTISSGKAGIFIP
jgi:CheY-like chemotaxis protein